MKIVKEHLDWAGRWVPSKEDPFSKSREYFYKQELMKILLETIEKYKDKVNRIELSDIINDLHKKFDVKK